MFIFNKFKNDFIIIKKSNINFFNIIENKK